MVCCLARFELAAASAPDGTNPNPTLSTAILRHRSNLRRPWESEATENQSQQPRVVLQEFADYIEATYLKSLDPSIPLHLFTIMITRQDLHKLQLLVNTSNVLTKSSPCSPKLRQWAFDVSIRMLEDDNVMQSTTSLQGWLWYTHMYFPFPAYMYLVDELKQSCTGKACSRAWEAMDRNHKLRGLVGPARRASPMHIAFGKHFLDAWEARVRAEGERGRLLQVPEFITMIQGLQQNTQQQELQQTSGQLPGQTATGSMLAGIAPQDPQTAQAWYGASATDDLDLFAGFGDLSGMDYIFTTIM